MFYRKKPVVIEAHQMTEESFKDMRTWPRWLKEAWAKNPVNLGSVSLDIDGKNLVIETFEGPMRCSKNDWIIKGVKGELYACKPDIFARTYEKVEEAKV